MGTLLLQDQVGFIPGMHGMIWYMQSHQHNTLKKQTQWKINTGSSHYMPRAFEKIQNPFMEKVLEGPGIPGPYWNIVKPVANQLQTSK